VRGAAWGDMRGGARPNAGRKPKARGSEGPRLQNQRETKRLAKRHRTAAAKAARRAQQQQGPIGLPDERPAPPPIPDAERAGQQLGLQGPGPAADAPEQEQIQWLRQQLLLRSQQLLCCQQELLRSQQQCQDLQQQLAGQQGAAREQPAALLSPAAASSRGRRSQSAADPDPDVAALVKQAASCKKASRLVVLSRSTACDVMHRQAHGEVGRTAHWQPPDKALC